MRHYYDVKQLLELDRVINFIGTDEYNSHKEKRFRAADEQDISKNEAFILSNSEVKDLYKNTYERSSTLYYKEQIPFDEIMKKIDRVY